MLFNIDGLLQSIGRDSLAFLPELLLCGLIVLLLFLRLFPILDRVHLGWLALVGMLAIVLVSLGQWVGGYGLPTPESYKPNLEQARDDLKEANAAQPLDLEQVATARANVRGAERRLNQALPIYNGLLVYDRLTLFMRLLLFGFTSLVIWLSLLTGIPDREDSADFYCLLLGASLGMVLMASANHLLMIYLAVEMASLPSYALAGFLKGFNKCSADGHYFTHALHLQSQRFIAAGKFIEVPARYFYYHIIQCRFKIS